MDLGWLRHWDQHCLVPPGLHKDKNPPEAELCPLFWCPCAAAAAERLGRGRLGRGRLSRLQGLKALPSPKIETKPISILSFHPRALAGGKSPDLHMLGYCSMV